MRVVLHQFWRSSASWRVRWALLLKKVSFEIVSVDLAAREQLSTEHRAKNPIGHVPVLEIDGHTLAESVAIIEYLEERIDEPTLYPRDAYARARVRQMVEIVNAGIQPLQNLNVLARHSTEPEAQRAWAAHFNARGLQALESVVLAARTEFTAGRYCFGDSITAADLMLVPQMYSARRFGVDVSAYPTLVAIDAALRDAPHYDAALPERQPGAPGSA